MIISLDVTHSSSQLFSRENEDLVVTSEQIENWFNIIRALSRPETYKVEIKKIIQHYRLSGNLPQKAINTLHRDYLEYERTLADLIKWYQTSLKLGAHSKYLKYIQTVEQGFRAGCPPSKGAIAAMHKDFYRSEWIKLSRGLTEETSDYQNVRIDLRALLQGKEPDEILKILECNQYCSVKFLRALDKWLDTAFFC